MTIVVTPYLRALYNEAHEYPNRESVSIAFWSAVLHHFLPAPRWDHAHELPPVLNDPTEHRAMDIVSRKFVKKYARYFYAMILEGKKPNYTQQDVEQAEEQLREYSTSYLDSCNEDGLWGGTTLGTKARIWYIKQGDDNLTSYAPQTSAWYNDGPYIDADALDTSELEKAFKDINDSPWPTKKSRGITPEIPLKARSSNPFSGSTVPPTLVQTSYSGKATYAPPYGTSTSYTAPYSAYGTSTSSPPQASSYLGYSATSSTGPDSSNTHGRIVPVDPKRISSPSEEGSPGLESQEHPHLIPHDAIFVHLEVESKEGGDLYHFYEKGQHYIKGETDWSERSVETEDGRHDCVLCVGKKSGLSFWAWNLRDLSPYKRFC